MELKIAFQGRLRDLMARQRRVAEVGITNGVKQVTDDLKHELRGQVTDAGMGRRLANSWRARTYPRRGQSMNAAGWLWSNAPEIVRAHSQGVTIRARNGTYLAIPTDVAPERGSDGKGLSPSNVPAKFGELRFVPRSNGPPLLVADAVSITKSGRVGKQRKNQGLTKTGKFRKGVSTVPMFTLVPQVQLKKRLDPQGAATRHSARLGRVVKREIQQADREIPEKQRAI